MGDISALVKDNSRDDRLTDPVLFWGAQFMKKRISVNWGKWVRERQQEKWIVAEIQKVSKLSKLWSRYSFNNGAVSQLAFKYGVAEAVI